MFQTPIGWVELFWDSQETGFCIETKKSPPLISGDKAVIIAGIADLCGV
jgi:hypothetical protein